MSLLLTKLEQLDLRVREHADHVRVLGQARKLDVHILAGLSNAASIAIERLLLGTVPYTHTAHNEEQN